MNIYCHLGIHKTASTHLQRSLQKNRDFARQQQCALLIRDLHPQIANHLRRLVKEKISFETFRPIWTKYMNDQIKKGVKTIIISDENLLGEPISVHLKRKDNKIFYPKAKLRIEILNQIFKPFETKYVLYHRKQESLFKSLYLDGLKYFRYNIDLDSFLEICLEKTPPFNVLLNQLFEVVGPEQLIIKKFEEIYEDSIKFTDNFWKLFLNLESWGLEHDTTISNPSMSKEQAEIFRIFGSKNIDQNQRLEIKNWISKIPIAVDLQTKLSVPEHLLIRVKEKYKNDITYS